MTAQEAIKNITAYAYMEAENIPMQVVKAFDVAREALKKQIPKKPLFGTVNRDKTYCCSSCKNFIGFYDTRIYEYCHNCGQKLDWSEDDG